MNGRLSNRSLKDFAGFIGGGGELSPYKHDERSGVIAHTAPGTVTDSQGQKVKGFIKTVITTNPDGSKGTKTTFKPFAGYGYRSKEVPLSQGSDVTSASGKLIRLLQAGGFQNAEKGKPDDAERPETVNRDLSKDATKEIAGRARPTGTSLLGTMRPMERGLVRNNMNGGISIEDKQRGDDQASSAGGFSGNVYVAGVKWTLFGGTVSDYLKVFFNGSQPQYVSGMTMTDDAEVYQLSQTYGDIHETRS